MSIYIRFTRIYEDGLVFKPLWEVKKLVVVVASQVTQETLERWTFDVQAPRLQKASNGAR